MRVEQLGDGEPELAVVGGIHGDEPCGAHAVETLLAANPVVERPVKCIIANERALEHGVRYTEADLNRAFPGDPHAEGYEARLAAELLDEVRGCTVLALHATQSTPKPFAIVDEIGPLAESICPYLSIEAIVNPGCVDAALGAHVDAIEVECGLQGSPQIAENAATIVHEFLAATDAVTHTQLGSEPAERSLPVFRLERSIPKPPADSYAVHVENFEQVEEGTVFASIDGEALIAEEPFYPVLMSPYGYTNQFGYAAERTDKLETRDTTEEREVTARAVSAPHQ